MVELQSCHEHVDRDIKVERMSYSKSFRGGSSGQGRGSADTAAISTIPTLFPIAKPPLLPHLSFIYKLPLGFTYQISNIIDTLKIAKLVNMGRQSSSSPRSSIDSTANEGLPLYTSLEVSTPDTLTAPSEKATPDEVREFLVALLVKNRGLNQDHARRVASKWTLGTGRELNTYPPLLYAEIFGLEDAWMVYKEAKLFIKTEEKKKEKLSSKCEFCFRILW
jgi:hypothetical protein